MSKKSRAEAYEQALRMGETNRRGFLGGLFSAAGGGAVFSGSAADAGGQATGANYVITQVGNAYAATNGKTGAVEFRNSDGGSVIQQAINRTPARGRVVVRADVTVTEPIVFEKTLTYEHYGILEVDVDSGLPGIAIGTAQNSVGGSEIYVSDIIGKDNTKHDGIHFHNGGFNHVTVSGISNCRHGIVLHPVSETVDWVNENIIHFSTIYGCKKGFYIPPPPSRAKRANVEGTQLHGGLILGCEEDGIYISRGALAGGMFVTGGIDNGLEAREYVNNVRYPTDDSLGNLLALKFMFDGPAKEGNGDPVYQAHPHDILLNPHLGEIKIGNNEIHDGTQPPINLSYEEGNFGGDFEEFAPDQADATAPAYVATDRDGAEPTHRLFVESPDGWVSFAPEGTRRT